jgi:glutamate-1-semialdehyde 2,1-aminomutase
MKPLVARSEPDKEESMKRRDHDRLLADLSDAYALYSPASGALNERAKRSLVDGASHEGRLMPPFPVRIVAARGAWLKDEDGHDILDFWQGHFANLLGHNPEVVTATLAGAFGKRVGLQTGFTDRVQAEAAEILCRQTSAEQVRFTTSGSLATMWATLLARAFTGRDLVMKVGGGWHGVQPWGLKGVGYETAGGAGFDLAATEGLSPGLTEEVVITRFNDLEALSGSFRRHGDRLSCFIVEPFVGRGGLIPAAREYLQAARRLTHQYGALLILDEVISGFRFHAGDAGSLYGVKPDLATFGKVIGGGMPVAAVGGRADVMGLVGDSGGHRVRFSGGTYSAHPASMLAAKTQLSYLVDHKEEIYPRLAALGEQARRIVEEAFADEGIYARCTGYGNDAIPGSSLSSVLFPYDRGREATGPEDVWNPALSDVTLRETVLRLALLLEDVHVFHGLGGLSVAHTEADLERLGQACRRVARRIRPYL